MGHEATDADRRAWFRARCHAHRRHRPGVGRAPARLRSFTIRGRGRRREQPLRTRARHHPAPQLAVRHRRPRTYFASARSSESWIESTLGIPDATGHPVAGYGWVIPLGDGTLNVGVAVLSTYRDVRGVNTSEAARCVRAQHRRAMGDRSLGQTQGADPVPNPTRRVRRPEDGADVPRGRRRRRHGQPVQRRRRRCRPDDRPPGRGGPRRSAHHRQLDHPAAVPDDPQRRRRPVPQGRSVERTLPRTSDRVASGPSTRACTAIAPSGAVLRIAANELRDQRPGGAERAYAIANAISKFAPNW